MADVKTWSVLNVLLIPAVLQELQAETLVGHQLLQDVLCEALQSMEKEPAERRSELLMQMTGMKKSWSSSVALARQNWTLMMDQLQQWTLYHRGLKCLKNLFVTVGSVLPPTGQCVCSVQQLQSCTSLQQCVEEWAELHSPVLTWTSEVGQRLSETLGESDCGRGLQSELQDMKKSWEQIRAQLQTNKHLAATAVQETELSL
ncbi:uncharacterized protein LOC106512498, partial [Austrofundulus limnaeus]|uniref:Uncharacterized protein LOC106512498 n=1 Tax=Austrofundulus limnaeus TaxID=52670 RepID=A0A2I4AM51_AUSLI